MTSAAAAKSAAALPDLPSSESATTTKEKEKENSGPATPTNDSEETLKAANSSATIASSKTVSSLRSSVTATTASSSSSSSIASPRPPPRTPAKVFVPAGIAPVSTKPTAPQLDPSKKVVRKAKPLSLPSFLALPSDPPVFTTPVLDFAAHSEELLRLAKGLYRLRDHYFELYPAKPFPKETRVAFAARCAAERAARMKLAHKVVLERFLLLTKPYVQRKKERHSSIGLGLVGNGEGSSSGPLNADQQQQQQQHGTPGSSVPRASSPGPIELLGIRAASPCSSDDGTLIGEEDAEHHRNALARSNQSNPASSSTLPSRAPSPSNDPLSNHGFDATLRSTHLAVYRFLRGHINNYFSKHSPDAERDLIASSLLDPLHLDTHISLAECVLKRGDVEYALSLADAALKQIRTKEVLRMTAMVLRQASAKTGQGKQGREMIEQALVLGKEAVSMDLEDGGSWFGLGMTHLNLFFNATQDKQDLLRALKAFDKAASCKISAGASLPDLYYNRALVHQYLDELEKAIQDFEQANTLDPTAGWSAETDGLRRMVSRIIESISKRGHLRLTRISDVLHALRNSGPSVGDKRFKEAENKSFAEVMRSKGKKKKDNVVVGEEGGKVCLRFAVIADIEHTRVVPRSFLGMDRDGVVFCVAIYNIRPDAFRVGDDVSVLDPSCRDIDVASMSMKYPLVRIDNPAGVSVNGRLLTSSDVALTTCTCFLPGFVDSEEQTKDGSSAAAAKK